MYIEVVELRRQLPQSLWIKNTDQSRSHSSVGLEGSGSCSSVCVHAHIDLHDCRHLLLYAGIIFVPSVVQNKCLDSISFFRSTTKYF